MCTVTHHAVKRVGHGALPPISTYWGRSVECPLSIRVGTERLARACAPMT